MNTSEPVTDRTALADRIFQARVRSGLTHEALGDKLGVTSRSVYYWESGQKIPVSSLLKPIADATGHSVDWFLEVYPRRPLNGTAA